MNKLEIMIVDDSALIIKKLGAMLEQMGHEVVKTCKSGMEAVDTFQYLKEKGLPLPDLVTMDITMPEMDGIAATRRILGLAPDTLIIMVTSHGQEQMVIEAIEAGAKGYVLKPFKIEKLKASIDQVVSRYKQD